MFMPVRSQKLRLRLDTHAMLTFAVAHSYEFDGCVRLE